MLHRAADTDGAAALWKLEAVAGGLWKITNLASGKCLEARKGMTVVRQGACRDGDPLQQWRLEQQQPAAAGAAAADKPAATAADATATAAAEKPATAGKPAAAKRERVDPDDMPGLDPEHLKSGEVGTLACDYAVIRKIVDAQTYVAVPYGYNQRTTTTYSPDSLRPNVRSTVSGSYRPMLPLLLKGCTTAGMVTGEKVDLSRKVFRVTGTQDVAVTSRTTARAYVLELVK